MLNRIYSYFDTLRPGDKALLGIASLITLMCAGILIAFISIRFSTTIPARGGILREGLVDAPRFINPVLATTQTDKDLTRLVYSGVMRVDENGDIVPDLAESVTLDETGTTYTITLRHDIFFSDGVPVTSEDIVYTYKQIQNPKIASPYRAGWDSVSFEVMGIDTVRVILPTPYTPFIEQFTIGILPSHLWNESTASQFPYSEHNNKNPIGSGPYMIDSFTTGKDGLPAEYVFVPNPTYHYGQPKIAKLSYLFFQTDAERIKAFKEGAIDAIADVDIHTMAELGALEHTHATLTGELPRTFSLFLNKNKQPALKDVSARKALNALIDRNTLVRDVQKSYATPLYGLIGDTFAPAPHEQGSETGNDTAQAARDILTQGGWSQNTETQRWTKTIDGTPTELALTISTLSTPLFMDTANFIKTSCESIGIPVKISAYARTDIMENIIKPRAFEVLLFGSDIGRQVDLYPFLHSSRRTENGLNISDYTNTEADALLTTMRTVPETEAKRDAYIKLSALIQNELSVISLYSPNYLYIIDKSINLKLPGKIADQSERYSLIHTWYQDTDRVWSIFTK